MIQVKETKMQTVHIKGHKPFDEYDERLVAEAKLVLITIKNHPISEIYNIDVPILISLTEKPEVSDWCYGMDGLFEYKGLVNIDGDRLPNKVLALPEHFSPKYLQIIVDGKLKDGDMVLVECEFNLLYTDTYEGVNKRYYHIKLNSYNHITLHKAEEETYTKKEIKDLVYPIWYKANFRIDAFYPKNSEASLTLFDQWFNKNIK